MHACFSIDLRRNKLEKSAILKWFVMTLTLNVDKLARESIFYLSMLSAVKLRTEQIPETLWKIKLFSFSNRAWRLGKSFENGENVFLFLEKTIVRFCFKVHWTDENLSWIRSFSFFKNAKWKDWFVLGKHSMQCTSVHHEGSQIWAQMS